MNTHYAPDFGYCVTGYQPIKWVVDDTSLRQQYFALFHLHPYPALCRGAA
ncbi:MAG: hypothetical protein ACLSGF_05090 [Alistipes onderdonkii]